VTLANEIATGAIVVMALACALAPDVTALAVILGVLVVVAIATSWPRLSRATKVGAGGSLVAGAVLVVATGATMRDLSGGFAQMATVFAFFALVRLLEVPILTGRFHHALVRFFADRLRVRNRAAAGTMVTFGLTSGLSIGAVPIAYRFGEALWADGGRDDTEGLGRVVTQGFTAANAWTPVSPIVALALETTRAPILPVLAWAVPMALVAAGATMWLSRSSGALGHHVPVPLGRGAGEFLLAIVLLVGSIAAIDHFSGISPIGASMLSIIAAVTVWQLSLERPRAALRSVWKAVEGHRTGWPEQCTLFCAGGLLVGAARAFSRGVGGTTSMVTGPTLLLVVALPLAIVLLSGLSLYPLVSLAAFGTMLATQVTPDTSTSLALALIVGASVAFLVSPFTGLTLLVSSMSRRSSMEVAVHWNLRYGLALLAFGSVLVAVAYGVR
jgi:hypothetical protein